MPYNWWPAERNDSSGSNFIASLSIHRRNICSLQAKRGRGRNEGVHAKRRASSASGFAIEFRQVLNDDEWTRRMRNRQRYKPFSHRHSLLVSVPNESRDRISRNQIREIEHDKRTRIRWNFRSYSRVRIRSTWNDASGESIFYAHETEFGNYSHTLRCFSVTQHSYASTAR